MGGWKSGFKIKFLDNRGSIALVINKAMCKILQKYYKKKVETKNIHFNSNKRTAMAVLSHWVFIWAALPDIYRYQT